MHLSQTQSYTESEALQAYDAFNQYLLDPERSVYFRDSDKPVEVGAIWTQAIYWDMAMNAYKRTKEARYLQLVKDIYNGNKKYYADYN